ncbi:hypothetical protein EON63_15015 [archaeon]|nr:MAG: hypothetical protein EON63_15015 [archaeon]
MLLPALCSSARICSAIHICMHTTIHILQYTYQYTRTNIASYTPRPYPTCQKLSMLDFVLVTYIVYATIHTHTHTILYTPYITHHTPCIVHHTLYLAHIHTLFVRAHMF